MERFRAQGFVLDESLAFRWLDPEKLILEGRIRCAHGLFIDVKELAVVRDVRSRRPVGTTRYRFHAGVEGSSNRSIFRYDNAHAYPQEGHPDAHLKHRFDHVTWAEQRPPVWIGADARPQLRDVIEELRQWWETTGRHLDLAGQGDRSPCRANGAVIERRGQLGA